MMNQNYQSLLILLGPCDILPQSIERKFLEYPFFIHCLQRGEYIRAFRDHARGVHEIDVFLPFNGIDLVHQHWNHQNSRHQFHLYCPTDKSVCDNKNLVPEPFSNNVFHIDLIGSRLYRRAIIHTLIYMRDCENRSEKGDTNAGNLFRAAGEFLQEIAEKINQEIRKTPLLSQQPEE